ncbi:hypothetical protein U0070_012694 [Myodes glareolus]|uniref:Eukaryotic translation initiation factor 3 subunit D n=1 Tax=Myodes glareolus TaxID=447135 RepID=A0AAW0JRK8_MYOGA
MQGSPRKNVAPMTAGKSFMAAPGRHALEGTPKCLARVCTAPDHTGPAPGALAGPGRLGLVMTLPFVIMTVCADCQPRWTMGHLGDIIECVFGRTITTKLRGVSGMPYQPFSKGDRLGKAADWTGATYQDKRHTSKYSSQFGGGSQYAYFHEEDETSFQLVDTAHTQETAYPRNRVRFAQQNLHRDKDRKNMVQFNLQTLPKNAKQKERTNSLAENISEAMWTDEDALLGSVRALRHQVLWRTGVIIAKPLTASPRKPLRSIKCIFHIVTTTDDPVIQKLGYVFATDAILAMLMSCTCSVYSWDVVVKRAGSKLFDKRDNSDFHLLTVSESANEPPQDEGNSFNSPLNLVMEVTYINHNFSQQCLRMGRERYSFPNPNPFVEEDTNKNEITSVAQRYRRWKLGGDIDLEPMGECPSSTSKCSTSGTPGTVTLDSQRRAVIATELKNNSYKLARWTCCALLAGSEYLKLPYVSKYHVKGSSRHVILGTEQFASQINLSVENAWGILLCVRDICMQLEEGKHLILKDPNKQMRPTSNSYCHTFSFTVVSTLELSSFPISHSVANLSLGLLMRLKPYNLYASLFSEPCCNEDQAFKNVHFEVFPIQTTAEVVQ